MNLEKENKKLKSLIMQKDEMIKIANRKIELKDQYIQELEEKINRYQENGYFDYLNNPQYVYNKSSNRPIEAENTKLKKKIRELEEKVKKKELEIHKLKNEQEISNIINEAFEKAGTKVKNERGAGRKLKFTEAEHEEIRKQYFQGNTIREIAKMYQCSVGLVHKIIHEI